MIRFRFNQDSLSIQGVPDSSLVDLAFSLHPITVRYYYAHFRDGILPFRKESHCEANNKASKEHVQGPWSHLTLTLGTLRGPNENLSLLCSPQHPTLFCLCPQVGNNFSSSWNVIRSTPALWIHL